MDEVNLIANWLIILALLATSVRLTKNRKTRVVFLTCLALLAFFYSYTNELSLKEILEEFLGKIAELLASFVRHLPFSIG